MAADWFVGPVMENLINRCFEYFEDQFRWQAGMKKELKRLRENHPKIQAVVLAATQAQIGDRNPALNKWLWQLRDAIDEADDLLDELEYMNYKEQVTRNNGETNLRSATMSFLFEPVCKLRRIGERAFKEDPILNRLEEVVHKLDGVSADFVTFLHLVDNAKQELQREQLDMHENREEGSLPKNDLIGRREAKKSVVRWLRQTSNEEHPTHIASTALYNKISIFSIVGHGGMGKTTLLQHIYEDEITKEFDLKMWVCVSNNFDVKRVIINMLESLKKKKPDLESLDALQDCLKSEVSSKKFLLVLDDIWEEDEEKDKRKWEKVLAPLAYGKLGSKILVTTRTDSVAAMITKLIKKKKKTLILRGLKEDECLELLNTYAFADVENPEDHRRLRSITVEIAKKLSGSPLAAKVIGGTLSSSLDVRHWTTVLNSDFRSAEFGQNDILPILRLSYTFLPRHLQNCFAFCSIFPQDHQFDKDDLVRMWIALGFIQSSANQKMTLEDIGGKYFDVLVRKSFFDEFRFRYNPKIYYYKMHDLLHELAQSISAQECFRVVRDKESHFGIPETIRHLSIETKNLEILEHIGKHKRLRSLFLRINACSEEIVDALTKSFQSLRSIRLLYISCQNLSWIRCRDLKLIPEVIDNLVHLRYLGVFEIPITSLPSSLSNLYHLQFIIYGKRDFYNRYYRNFLPRDMNNLFNLRYLKIPWNFFDEINGIGKLRSLQELNGFSVKNEVSYSIQELEHMNELRRLRIKLLENVKDDEQARKAKLCDKRNLTDLSLEWGNTYINFDKPRRYIESKTLRNIVDPDLDERVLDNLQPQNSLKELGIHAFMGVRSPIWLNDANLMSNLEYIQLDKCLEWQTLPPFGKLPFLKSLSLCNMPKVKSIDYKYHRNENDCFFLALEQLHFEQLDALEDWFDATITDACFFPSLTELYLKDCPNLKELPCLPPKLTSLEIDNIRWKTLSCHSISKSISLRKLIILKCPNITALRVLEIDNCPNLISHGGHQHQEVETIENCRLKITCLRISNPSMFLLGPLRSISSLRRLHISDNDELVSFPSEVEQWFLQVSSSLFELQFDKLKSLRSLPSSLESFSSLNRLHIEDVPQLQILPDFPASLENLCLKKLESVQCLPSSLSTISSLKTLRIVNVPQLQQLPDLPASLNFLHLIKFESLQCLPSSLSTICFLKKVWIEDIPLLQQLPDLPASLEFLDLTKLESLQCIPSSLSIISSLKTLHIVTVPLLQQLPDLPSSLEELFIQGCHEELRKRYDVNSGFDRDKLAHIPYVRIEEIVRSMNADRL